MRKICFLNGDMSRSGGTERVTAIIASELSKLAEFDIHILSVNNEDDKSYFSLNEQVTHYSILRQKDMTLKRDYHRVVTGIRRYLKQHKIDILIDVDVICNLYSIPATRFMKTKLISWEHFNYFSNNGSRLRDISRQLAKYFSDHIVVLTEQDKQNYSEQLNVGYKTTCLYNPISMSHEQCCDIQAKQLLSVGRLTYQKGFDLLCEVANHVLHANPDWTWTILGEGEDRPMLEQNIKDYNLIGRLILKGNQSDVETYYQNSSIFVMTSRYEGLPMTLLEAKSFGLPIVSFDCQTGPRDIIHHDIDGYLAELEDIQVMSNQIKQLINEESKRVSFSERSQISLDKFDFKTIVSQWQLLLREL